MSRTFQALLFLLPATAVAAFPFFSTFSVPKLLLAGPVVGFLLLRQTRPREDVSDPASLLLLLWLLASLPAYAASQRPSEMVTQAVLDLLGVGVYFLARSSDESRGEERVAALARWAATAAGLVIGFYFLEKLSGLAVFFFAAVPGSSTMGNPDVAAELAAVCLPATLYLALAGRTRGRLALCGALAAGSVALIIDARSLTAGIAAAVSVGMAALLHLLHRRGVRCLLLWAMAAALLLLAAVPLVATGRHIKGRIYMGRLSLAAAVERLEGDPCRGFPGEATCTAAGLALGHGIGSFPGRFLELQGQHIEEHREDRNLWTNARHAHDEWLHQLVERGALPPLLLALFVGVLLAAAVRRLNRTEEPAPRLFLAATLAASALVFTGSISFQSVPLRLLFFAAAGLVPLEPLPGVSAAPLHRALRGTARACLTCAAPLLLLLPVWSATADFLFVQQAPAAADAVFPWSGRTRRSLAARAFADGHTSRACRLIEESLRLEPDLGAHIALGDCYRAGGEYNRALGSYSDALGWKPTFSVAYGRLALLDHALGEEERARRNIIRALSLNPGDPTLTAIRDHLCPGDPKCSLEPRRESRDNNTPRGPEPRRQESDP